jgi:NAD+ diphosphatase
MTRADASPPPKIPLAYSTPDIDRSVLIRGDDTQLKALLKSSAARFVPVWRHKHLVAHAGDAGPRPRYLSFTEADDLIAPTAAPPVFLGMTGETPWFALGIGSSDRFRDEDFRDLNALVPFLPGDEATLLAYARGMVIWHENHRHCGRCGHATEATEGGHSRTCTNDACKHRSFPRTDPAIITLIEHPDGAHCLLGRQASWPPGFYSTVAGFVEPGESLEGAVIREVREETGIDVTDVRYMASQPWPFPSSIMLGFRARAINTNIRPDDQELEDCRWFTRDEVAAFGGFGDDGAKYRAPPAYAISRFLIDGWLHDT